MYTFIVSLSVIAKLETNHKTSSFNREMDKQSNCGISKQYIFQILKKWSLHGDKLDDSQYNYAL